MLLLIRPDDLVVLGVSWSGFRLDGTTLVALSDDARLVVIFPPQHVAEEIIDGGTAQAQAQLSGISQVVYSVRGTTQIDLTAEGILGALAAATITTQTAVELPWGLALSPAAASTSDHQAFAARTAGTGDIGLWRTRLSPGAVKPADVRPGADPGFRAPVRSQDRARIVAESARALPSVRRLELTALGGSLSARGDWDTFKWEQTVASGRDQRVRFAISGLLYPLGHRAVFTEITERQIGDGPAALRQRRTLAVTEPVRTSAVDDPVQRRFPFDEFELTTVRYDDLPDPDVPGTPSSWEYYTRPVPMIDDVRGQVAGLQAQSADLAAQVDAEGHRFRPPDELAAAGMPEANQLIADEQSLGDKQQTLADDEANREAANQISGQIDDLQRQIDMLSANDPESPELAPLEQEVQADVEELRNIPLLPNPVVSQLSGEVQQLQAEVDRLTPIVDAEGHRFRDVNELANDGFQPAIDLLNLQPVVAAAEAKLAELEQIAAQQLDLFFTPPILFPVRASGRAGDVHFSVALIFVADFTLAPTDDLPGVQSLTDPGVADRLRAAYAASAVIPLPGAPVDLVRAAAPQPADVHQVYEMTISGTPSDSGFRPQADQFMVALPALRTLLDAPDMLVPLKFQTDFFNPAEEVALKLGRTYPAEFATVPGRTGGLVIPSFTADAISRLNGPVALAGTVRDAAGKLSTGQVFGDTARILGLKITDLIPHLDSPPQIQLQPPNAVTMTWKDVQLADHPPIRTAPTTKLNLTVERSPDHVKTTCDIADLTLQFPMLDVAIGSIAYTQLDDHPPHLELHGVVPDVTGPLRLLKELLDKVDLGSAGPDVRVTGTEITAGYALSIPDVETLDFTLRAILFRLGVTVPLDGKPVTVEMGFATRAHPFLVSVLLFGGGGYVDLAITGDTVTRFEVSLEFGAATAISLGVATAEVHVLGGVRYELPGGYSGYLRIGGGVEILGLISVSVELVLALTFQPDDNALTGRATLVVTIDLTFYSDSVTLDTGEYRISGAPRPSHALAAEADADLTAGAAMSLTAAEAGLAAWREYRRAFRKDRS